MSVFFDFVLYGIALACIFGLGALIIFRPDLIWKFEKFLIIEGKPEPTVRYYWSVRLLGIAIIITGIMVAVMGWPGEEEFFPEHEVILIEEF